MGVDIFKVLSVVLLRCKPDQALLKDIHPQGIDRSKCHIDPQIKLKPINQVRLLDVLLDDTCGLTSAPWDFLER